MRNQREEKYQYIYHKNAYGKHRTVHLLNSLDLHNISIYSISIQYLEEDQAFSLPSSASMMVVYNSAGSIHIHE